MKWSSALVLTCFLAYPPLLHAQDSFVEVTSPVKVTSSPSPSSPAIGFASPGRQYEVLLEYPNWIKIQFGEQKGWLPRSVIKIQVVDTPSRSPAPADTSVEREKMGFLARILPKDMARERVISAAAAMAIRDSERVFVHISNPFLSVFSEPTPLSPVLIKVRKGESYHFLDTADGYYRIALNDSDSGWVDARHVTLVDDPKAYTAGMMKTYLVVFAWIIGVALAIIGVLRVWRIQWVRHIRLRQSLLILATEEKIVQHSITQRSITVRQCVTEIGFTVLSATSIPMAMAQVVRYHVDGILADWQMTPTLPADLQSALQSRTATSGVPVVFYNVPDAELGAATVKMPNVHLLGVGFSDRDLMTAVLPLLATGKKAVVQKSVQSSAIEGEIGEGNLSAIFQLIELGRKSGMLLISDKSPVGMVGFDKGRVVYASADQSTGVDAVMALLDQKKGQFRFYADKTAPSQNCNVSTLEVLMEWARRQDETHVR